MPVLRVLPRVRGVSAAAGWRMLRIADMTVALAVTAVIKTIKLPLLLRLLLLLKTTFTTALGWWRWGSWWRW